MEPGVLQQKSYLRAHIIHMQVPCSAGPSNAAAADLQRILLRASTGHTMHALTVLPHVIKQSLSSMQLYYRYSVSHSC